MWYWRHEEGSRVHTRLLLLLSGRSQPGDLVAGNFQGEPATAFVVMMTPAWPHG